jgi:hypothetical protein
VSCPWTGREGKQFSTFLASVPDWSLEKLRICVANYFASLNTCPGVPAFSKLPQYAECALDQYGHGTTNRVRAFSRSFYRRHTEQQAEDELSKLERSVK